MATVSETPTAQCSPLVGLSITTALVNGVQVPVACPAAWCTENHTTEDTRHAEDIDHAGDNVDLMVPDFFGDEDQVFAYAHLGQDVYSNDALMRAAHIRVEDGGGEVSYLTPDQGDTFAGNLDAFGSKIRVLAQVARGAATAAPGHFTWCEPGACVTRQGEDGPVTEHVGARAIVEAPEGFDAWRGQLFNAYLFADDSMADSGPRVSAISATGNGQTFGADELDKLIDQTAAALDQLRGMRLHIEAAQA
ncbi:DUF6907 domain-containing protein [Streptomyces sp. NPDC058614]|uniref:DUF6907 domain-containing protein n=1 Tax=Streptomyces sp. NPDC058614 TaxID=3346557 RepID=UPI003649E39B